MLRNLRKYFYFYSLAYPRSRAAGDTLALGFQHPGRAWKKVMDEFRIDSHKLMYHVDRVNDWLSGGNIYPIYMEVSPIGACNHRCTYCGLDYMEYQPRYLDPAILKARLTEMGSLGLKSIMYAGEGEPFLHKDITNIINHTKASGIDVAITSNGVLFTKKIIEAALAS